MIKVRRALRTELEWINHCYDAVQFVHSHWDNEIIAVAEFEGQRAGLGRLVSVDERHLELGGIYVFESYRNKGIAGKLVEYLMERVVDGRKVYCIPFEPLVSFYRRYGFSSCTHLADVPESVLKKYQCCQEKYPVKTQLLVAEHET